MKLKRKTKVGMWMAEKRHDRLIAEAWLKTDEGQEWLKEWRAGQEKLRAEVRSMLSETMSMSDALKQLYPDNTPPAAMRWEQ